MAPFLGAIGQQSVKHDPLLNESIQRHKTLAELARRARTGDVLVTSKPSGSFWKSFIRPLTGSEFYHVQPVVGRRGGQGTTTSAGSFSDPSYAQDTRQQLRQQSSKIPAEMKHLGYEDAVLLRPNKKLTPEQKRVFIKDMMGRAQAPYNTGNAVKTWLHDLFVPKLESLQKGKDLPVCEGGVCSSAPAMAYNKAGIQVAKGKAQRNAFPGDFLRSDALRPVGAVVKSPYSKAVALRKATPWLARGAVGAGLAGGIYATSEDPALLGAVPGVVAGSALGGKLEQVLRGKKAPVQSIHGGLIATLMEARKGARRRLLHRALTGRIPGALLGGGLAYGASRALQGALRRPSPSEGTGAPPVAQPARTG